MVEESPYFKVINVAFPKIGHKIQVFWGYPEFTALMMDLQTDSADRPRAGFPAEVLFAMHELQKDHDLGYPELAHSVKDVWSI